MCQLVPFSESEAAQSAEVVRPFDADVHRLEETLPAHLPIEEETLPVVAEERSSHASRSDGRCDWVHGLNVASLSLLGPRIQRSWSSRLHWQLLAFVLRLCLIFCALTAFRFLPTGCSDFDSLVAVSV